MKIAIGTKRKAKIKGVKKGIAEFIYIQDTVEFSTHDADSGISHMPLSLDETMSGAQNRALDLKNKNIEADYYIGLEGGLVAVQEKTYLISLAYVLNNNDKGHFGFSPMLEVPQEIHKRIKEGEELGPIMGELSGNLDLRSENGSMGAWSGDMFKRDDEFAVAVKAALCPFYNQYYKI